MLFIALPIGAKPSDNPEKGHATSAPKNPHIRKKLAISFIISLIITIIYFYLLENNFFAFMNLRQEY